MARVEFAPDGKHFQTIKRGSIGKLWDYFVFDLDIRIQLALNPSAKFRLWGEKKLIGTLPK